MESENLLAISNPQVVAQRENAFQKLLQNSSPIDSQTLQDLSAKFKNKISMSRFLELIYGIGQKLVS